MKVVFVKSKLDAVLCDTGSRSVIMIIIAVALAQIRNSFYHTMLSYNAFICVYSSRLKPHRFL